MRAEGIANESWVGLQQQAHHWRKIMRFNALHATAVAASLFLVAGALQAQEIREKTFKFAHQNSKEHPQGMGVAKFAELLSQKSGGKMKVQQFPGGQLGGDLQNVSALQGGTVDFVVLNTGLLVGLAKETAIVDLPFLFNDPKEADAVMDGPFGKKLHDKVMDKNVVGLAFWELGFRNVTNSKRPITKMEDIAGLKLRVLQSPLFIDTFTTLGANPTPMPFPEVYSALEQKVVDGQENPVTVVADSKFNEVQKHLALTRHIYNPQSVIMSKKVWDQLNPAERKVIQEAATEATAFQRQTNRKKSDEALESLKKAGMQVTELPPAEVAKIREKLKPVVAKYAAQAGEPLYAELNAEIMKVRGK
jgi:tripartite ATP-independent transporter DctP family solute receptor